MELMPVPPDGGGTVVAADAQGAGAVRGEAARLPQAAAADAG